MSSCGGSQSDIVNQLSSGQISTESIGCYDQMARYRGTAASVQSASVVFRDGDWGGGIEEDVCQVGLQPFRFFAQHMVDVLAW